MSLKYFGKSVKGTRSSENEDFFLLPEDNEQLGVNVDLSRGSLFILCDGMGGAASGEVVSNLCANWFLKEFYSETDSSDPASWLLEEIKSLNNRLYQLSTEHKQYRGMGTTLVNLLIRENKAWVNNVGDSRLYRFSNGQLTQVTEDQSPVWRLYREGAITKDEILTNKRKNEISQAIASSPVVEPNSYQFELSGECIFLMCSDGLTDVATDSQIEQAFQAQQSLEGISEGLFKLARDGKTEDDTTIILVSNCL